MAFVLVHGGLNTGRCWRLLAPLLDEPALAVDLPGRGARAADHRSISLEGNARDVLAQMDDAGIESAHIVGHSLGGGTIISIAAVAPGRVSSLTFVASPVPQDGDPIFSVLGESARAFIGHHRDQGDTSLPVPGATDNRSALGEERGVPEAVAPFFDPVPVRSVAALRSVNYIRTGRDSALEPALQDAAITNLRQFAQVDVKRCNADHMAMLTEPGTVAGLLNDIAASQRTAA